jgi:NAD(P)H-dependent FMN reductase
MTSTPTALILNGSPSGKKGNCAKFIAHLKKSNTEFKKFEVVHLAEKSTDKKIKEKILNSDAVIFVTGTYWDSWGSPLQKFLEDITDLEAHPKLMGKPCAVFVLMHSVGGKGVLSRLQGVLSTMGFLIPPMSGMVYSLVSDIALRSKSNTHAKDFWHKDDAELILKNLKVAAQAAAKTMWISWPVDKKNPRRLWF